MLRQRLRACIGLRLAQRHQPRQRSEERGKRKQWNICLLRPRNLGKYEDYPEDLGGRGWNRRRPLWNYGEGLGYSGFIAIPFETDCSRPLHSQRSLVENAWNAVALAAGAAKITIVNEVDDEEVPPLPKGFEYLEVGYV